MRSPASAIRAVPAREWPDVVVAAAVAVVVEVGLRVATLPRLARLLGTPLQLDAEPATTPGGPRPRLPAWAVRRQRAVRRVLRHWPFGDTCLRYALVCGQRLRRLDPVLRVGVARVDGNIQAHAWLEIGGASLDPQGSTTHRALRSVREAAAGGGAAG